MMNPMSLMYRLLKVPNMKSLKFHTKESCPSLHIDLDILVKFAIFVTTLVHILIMLQNIEFTCKCLIVSLHSGKYYIH